MCWCDYVFACENSLPYVYQIEVYKQRSIESQKRMKALENQNIELEKNLRNARSSSKVGDKGGVKEGYLAKHFGGDVGHLGLCSDYYHQV